MHAVKRSALCTKVWAHAYLYAALCSHAGNLICSQVVIASFRCLQVSRFLASDVHLCRLPAAPSHGVSKSLRALLLAFIWPVKPTLTEPLAADASCLPVLQNASGRFVADGTWMSKA